MGTHIVPSKRVIEDCRARLSERIGMRTTYSAKSKNSGTRLPQFKPSPLPTFFVSFGELLNFSVLHIPHLDNNSIYFIEIFKKKIRWIIICKIIGTVAEMNRYSLNTVDNI